MASSSMSVRSRAPADISARYIGLSVSRTTAGPTTRERRTISGARVERRATGGTPGPRRYTAAVRSHTDYALARRAVLRDLRRGVVTRLDVCDAHPELLRAARNVGEPAPHDCPVCGADSVRLVSYVYGEKLREANGRCISHPTELE